MHNIYIVTNFNQVDRRSISYFFIRIMNKQIEVDWTNPTAVEIRRSIQILLYSIRPN